MLLEQPEWGVFWQYILLFFLAAAPWLEVFLVVPLGIAWGLQPVSVAVIGFAGNWIPVLLIALFFHQFKAWRIRRKARKEGRDPHEVALEAAAAEEQAASKKRRRARGIWERYGIPGLALLAPAIVGTDIAALLALSFGSKPRWVLLWMTVSLALWTIALAVGTVYGLDFVGWFQRKDAPA
ncbi:Putative small multi-drug export protein [Paenibacillus sp. UNCCL117]|uniref:small multi-drug export protein n=1 Tax=unclassified Paenibacillus TaxID=185978 RepID=UPI000882A367|nr:MULTISPECIES: small multi-drug export protein [unclassified Paenibacillus]SDD78146.1 Putative small multi-drug export protein [Paenibacillus sp. cl123]SFW52905.1 Putative small multi-drug export protein [Paenibacillus sp. UNCCL117]